MRPEFRTTTSPHGFSIPVTSPHKPPLNDRASYNASLAESLGAKLFFMQHIPMHKVGLVLDFGCADGSLLKALRHAVAPGAKLIGIDSDVSQCAAARCNFPEATGFYTRLDWAEQEIANAHVTRDLFCGERCSLLILSSVLHEVLSDDGDMLHFWKPLEALGFDYIAVRDMAVPQSYRLTPTSLRWLDRCLHAPSAVVDKAYGVDANWGQVSMLNHFVHFLLKYPYAANWERELAENYLPYSVEEIEHYVTTTKQYAITHSKRTSTKHFRERVQRDLGIDVSNLTTHLEMVLKRRA